MPFALFEDGLWCHGLPQVPLPLVAPHAAKQSSPPFGDWPDAYTSYHQTAGEFPLAAFNVAKGRQWKRNRPCFASQNTAGCKWLDARGLGTLNATARAGCSIRGRRRQWRRS